MNGKKPINYIMLETKGKIIYTPGAEYPYNVQIWNGGNYCGNGRYFKTREEAQVFKNRMENGNG